MLLVDWDQCFTVLFIQSLIVTLAHFLKEQDMGISIFDWSASSVLIDDHVRLFLGRLVLPVVVAS